MAGPNADRRARSDDWPELPLDAWKDTLATLHLWSQVVGKVALALSPPLPHWWGCALQVTPRGLATSTLHHGARPVRLLLDLVDHELVVEAGVDRRRLPLAPMTVADFHARVLALLDELGCPVVVNEAPQEVTPAVPFSRDREHASYDAAAVGRFRAALVTAHRLVTSLGAEFLGKASPAHFFWGSFDLAYSRYSGRIAPEHPGGVPNLADWVTREAYAREVWSCGWWPGNGPYGPYGRAAFYAYAWPTPQGFASADLGVPGAAWNAELGEFLLPWDVARTAPDPEATVLAFLRNAYVAAADAAGWDRAALERTPRDLAVLEARIRRSDRPLSPAGARRAA